MSWILQGFYHKHSVGSLRGPWAQTLHVQLFEHYMLADLIPGLVVSLRMGGGRTVLDRRGNSEIAGRQVISPPGWIGYRCLDGLDWGGLYMIARTATRGHI